MGLVEHEMSKLMNDPSLGGSNSRKERIGELILIYNWQ